MNLRDWRNTNGISASDLAARCGIAYSTLVGYENGSRRPRPELARRIEKVTGGGVTAAELLGVKPSLQSGLREDGTVFTPEADIRITLPKALIETAKTYGLDIESLVAEGGITKLKAAIRQCFNERNREAIVSSREYIETYGTFSQQIGAFPK